MAVSLAEAIRATALVSVAVAACGSPAVGQTAEELIAKNISAKGGMDNIKAITNLRTALIAFQRDPVAELASSAIETGGPK